MTSNVTAVLESKPTAATLLWVPHVAIAVSFLTFLAFNFYCYHMKYKQRYQRKSDESEIKARLKERRRILNIVKLRHMIDPGAMEMYINMSGGGGESIRVQRADHTDQEEGDPQADWMRDEMSNEDSNVSGDQSNSWVYPPGSQAQYKGGYLFFLLLLRKFAVQDVC